MNGDRLPRAGLTAPKPNDSHGEPWESFGRRAVESVRGQSGEGADGLHATRQALAGTLAPSSSSPVSSLLLRREYPK